jgi:hypothetical protein
MPRAIGSDRHGAGAKSDAAAPRRPAVDAHVANPHATDTHTTDPCATDPCATDSDASPKRGGVRRHGRDAGDSHDSNHPPAKPGAFVL